jgi:ribosome-associated toxin RatA of RatAB toxin-antitoxin module
VPKVQTDANFSIAPDAFYDLIVDFKKLPGRITGVESVTVLDATPDAWVVVHTIRVIKRFTYTLAFRGERGKFLEWTQVEGPFKVNEGRWTLADDGVGGTAAHYEMNLELGMLVPRAISKGLIASDLPRLMSDWRKAAEALPKG